MLLAIDVGNTNIVFALFDGDTLTRSWRTQTDISKTSEQYLAVFSKEIDDFANIYDVIMSSVVPSADDALIQFCKQHINKSPIIVAPNLVNIPVDLDNPNEIGADRLVNAAGVLSFYQTPAIVIDFGTATTFDVISSAGHYSGGVIAPGLNLSLDALQKAAAKLPMVEVNKPKDVIGTNTVSAMQSGLYWGYVGLVSGIIDKIKQETPDAPLIIATGGLANLFSDDLTMIDLVDHDLTLKGLLSIYQAQQKVKAATSTQEKRTA